MPELNPTDDEQSQDALSRPENDGATEMNDDDLLRMAMEANNVDAGDFDAGDRDAEADDEADADMAKSMHDADSADGGDPAPADKGESGVTESTNPEQTAENKGDLSWVDALPEEAKQRAQSVLSELEKTRGNYQAVHGKLAPTQRRVAELERQLQRAQETLGRLSNPENRTPPEDSEKWKQYKEQYPEEAEPHEERYHQLERRFQESQALYEARIARLEGQSESITEREAERQFTSERNRLKSDFGHSDFDQIVGEGSDWNEWLATQPAEIQSAAEAVNADTYDRIVNLYKIDHGIPLPSKHGGDSSKDTPAASSSTNEKVQRIQQRRQQQRNDLSPGPSATRPSSTRGASMGSDLDSLTNQDDIAAALLETDEFSDLRKEFGGR